MDFWSKLVAGTPLASKSRNQYNPERILAKFKREYNQLLTLWRAATNLSRDYEAAEDVRNCIQELTNMLSDESRRPLPHPCIGFAAAKQLYIPIGKIATTSYDEGIIREGVAFFATLIDSEEESFVENDTFSKSLMNLLVRITGGNSVPLGSDTEVELVELSFNITTKIRLDPEVLPVWFTAHDTGSESSERDAHEMFTGKQHKEDFPLFYLLIDFIHHEGRTGDFARTGLLYIIEAASNSAALEQWIVESDLATLMATGLGALYSQLSRKLVIDHPYDQLPPILALSDYEHPHTTHEIVSSASPEFQAQMETFLSHLMFWQDVLNHCKSSEVKSTLLEHFQVIFLQQLLYPSLLESSDVDGGSSVAVLTYLRRILEALDHPDMIHLILHYLLALPDTAPVTPSSKISAARKRKSMDLATLMSRQQFEVASTPALFNLVDLIQGSLRSQIQQTVSVTLQLISVILRRHHRYAVTTLLWTSQILHDRPQRTVGAHDKEMEFLFTLVGDIGGNYDIDEVYQNHITDSMGILESHPCSIKLVAPKSPGGSPKAGGTATIPGGPRELRAHTLRPEDPMLNTMLGILESFFMNPIETNLSLTAAIIDLATCGLMRVDGWLLPDPSKYIYEDEEDKTKEPSGEAWEIEEQLQLQELKKARRCPKWSDSQLPLILIILRALVEQVLTYQAEIPRFDELLQQRRDAFQAASLPAPAPTPARQAQPRSSVESTPRSASPPRNALDALEALAQRVFPELGTPSRSRSPRGRRSQDRSRNSGSFNGGYGERYGFTSPNSSRNPPTAPAQFPMGLDTPPRNTSRAFSVSPLREADEVATSQAAAFAAVDQSILARKVSMPLPKGEVEPIPFPDLKGAASQDGEGGTEENGEEDSAEKVVEEQTQASVSHVLTNVIVLQEFLLELAALVQVRAGLFGEVRFG